MNIRGLVIFFAIPIFIITILLFINNLAFLGADNIPKGSSALESTGSQQQQASDLSETDFLKLFFRSIVEQNPNMLLGMLDPSVLDSQKSAEDWMRQFNAFENVELISAEPSDEAKWKDNEHTFKIVVKAKMNPESATASIPYYGWGDGENTKWVTIRRGEDKLWRVVGFASGP